MQPSKELIGASTRLLILATLAREANYGYAIIKSINDEANGLFVWQEGTVYPLLHKLEKEGCLRTQWQQADTGRKRKYYYITATGRDMLEDGAEHWKGFHQMIQSLSEAPNG